MSHQNMTNDTTKETTNEIPKETHPKEAHPKETNREQPKEQPMNNSSYTEERAAANTEAAAPQYVEGAPPTMTKISDIQRMTIDQLNIYAKQIGLKHLGSMTKSQMVFEIVKLLSEHPQEVLCGEGVLEVLPDGFGFLRSPNYNYLPSAEDIYVSPAQIRRFDLKKGDTVVGQIRPPKEKEKYFALLKVDRINS